MMSGRWFLFPSSFSPAPPHSPCFLFPCAGAQGLEYALLDNARKSLPKFTVADLNSIISEHFINHISPKIAVSSSIPALLRQHRHQAALHATSIHVSHRNLACAHNQARRFKIEIVMGSGVSDVGLLAELGDESVHRAAARSMAEKVLYLVVHVDERALAAV